MDLSRSALLGGVAEIFYAVVRVFDLGILTRNNLAQRCREIVSHRLFIFFDCGVFSAFAFSQDRVVIASGDSGFQVDPGAVQCASSGAAGFGFWFTQTAGLALQFGREPRTLL